MSTPGIDPKLMDALNGASNLELFQLRMVIDRLLDDPRRIIAIRTNMHLGQTVRFMDWRDGQMRSGHVVAMGDTRVTVHDTAARTQWKLSYAAVEPPQTANRPAQAPAAPPPIKPGRNDFRCGDKVSFEDKYLQTHIGSIVRINQRTATIDTGEEMPWRVGFGLLRPVVDI